MKKIAVALTFFFLSLSDVQAQTQFFAGKTIRIIVGLPAGDVYDIYSRILAKHRDKYIQENHNIIVKNIPGAPPMTAANYVYNVAKPDGLTFASFLPALYFDQLIGRKEVQFDWGNFTWLGSFEKSYNLLYMRADAPYKTIHDVTKASDPPKCGSTGTGGLAHAFMLLLNEAIGARFNIVTGYQGGQEIDLAGERGEVHCRAFTVTSFFAREPFHTWRKKGFVRVLVQTGKKRDPRMADVPTVYELMDEYKTPQATRRLATLVLAAGEFGRPIVATPGVPPDRVKILREAFAKTLGDADVVADVQKKKLELDPTSGEELENLAKEVITSDREIIDRMKQLLS